MTKQLGASVARRARGSLARGLLAALPAIAALPASAHEGHGLAGPHWHAGDALLFVGALAAVGALVWLRRRK